MIIEFSLAFLFFYTWHMMGITIGYHRLLSHRSFKCPKAVEYFWVLAGYLAFEGSPIWWATIHRAHHRYTDLPFDPHSPRAGWLKSTYGWVTKGHYPAYIDPQVQAKDLTADPIYLWLEQKGSWEKAHIVNGVIGVAFRLLLLACFGWPIAAASLAAGLIVQQVPLLLNLICHLPKLGYTNYDTDDDSVNVWWVALLTCGEGWHNNHHAFPGSARNGFRLCEFDLSWQVIRLMKAVGLVSWLHEENCQSQYKRPTNLSITMVPAVDAREISKVGS